MTEEQKNNPLHGVKLETLLKELVDHYGWDVLAYKMNLNCFKSNPSIKSSLKFLRRTEWAREKIERFYLYDYRELQNPSKDEYEIPPRKRTVLAESKAEPSQEKTPHTRVDEPETANTETTESKVINTEENSAELTVTETTKPKENTPDDQQADTSTEPFSPWSNSRHVKK